MNYEIGADEVGYGSLAGPLVICGVKAYSSWNLDGLNDSKKLSVKKRLNMRELILKEKITHHIAERSNKFIDENGISFALHDCYNEIFDSLYESGSRIIVDGNLKFDKAKEYNIVSIVKADSKVPTVMAASILAKTYRDDKMKELDKYYPEYNFKDNVGYGSKFHLEAIKTYGPSDLHRMSYAPMKTM
jgi:ribonuclease HII